MGLLTDCFMLKQQPTSKAFLDGGGIHVELYLRFYTELCVSCAERQMPNVDGFCNNAFVQSIYTNLSGALKITKLSF